MSDPKDKTPVKLPADDGDKEIKEPTDPDDVPDEDDDPEGEPIQPDGEK